MHVGLVILDGWGLNPDPAARDAVRAADTSTVDRLRAAGAAGTLETHGDRVGLPSGQMGNSEVGHLTVGAGRVVYQESARITDAIRRWRDGAGGGGSAAAGGGSAAAGDVPADPPLDENEALASAFEYADSHEGTVHLLGLVSDGGVHSYQSHLHALIELAAERGVPAVTHAFTDGRDTDPTGGAGYLADLASHVESIGTGDVATVTGRYYAMDRDENWERTRRAYDAIVAREADHEAPSAVAAVEQSYERDVTDEFVEPTLVDAGPALADGDAAIFANFRSDRARQLTRMLAGIEPDWESDGDGDSDDGGGDAGGGEDAAGDAGAEGQPDPAWPPADGRPAIELVTMTEYDGSFDLPVAFPPRQPADTLGEVLAETGHTQLRIAETEKYAHVTYFLNGGREVEFPGERREIVPSPDVATYDRQPEMSAPEVTDRAVDVFEREDPDVVVLNYANPDMVGHTGDFDAAVAAVEAVDAQLDRLVTAMRAAGAHVLLAADHGNADEMGTAEAPHTAHTTNPVPFVSIAPPAAADGPAVDELDDAAGGYRVREGGGLADVAPTVLALLGVELPPAMTGEPLLVVDAPAGDGA